MINKLTDNHYHRQFQLDSLWFVNIFFAPMRTIHTIFEVTNHIFRELFNFVQSSLDIVGKYIYCMNDSDKRTPYTRKYPQNFYSNCSFATHYEGNREPYILMLVPFWMKTDYKLDGTIQFVNYLRAAFSVSPKTALKSRILTKHCLSHIFLNTQLIDFARLKCILTKV